MKEYKCKTFYCTTEFLAQLILLKYIYHSDQISTLVGEPRVGVIHGLLGGRAKRRAGQC